MEEVVEEVVEEDSFGVDVADEDGVDADIGDEDNGCTLVTATDMGGGNGCCFSSKLRECGRKFAFFVGLIRHCKVLLILLLLLRLPPVRCDCCGWGTDAVVPPQIEDVVIVFLLLFEYDGGVDMTRPSFRGGMRCPTLTVDGADVGIV